MRATRMRRILSGWRIKALKVTLRWAGRSDWRQLTRTIQRFGNGCVQKLRTADGRTLYGQRKWLSEAAEWMDQARIGISPIKPARIDKSAR